MLLLLLLLFKRRPCLEGSLLQCDTGKVLQLEFSKAVNFILLIYFLK